MAGPGEQASRPKEIGGDYGKAGYAAQDLAGAARDAASDAMQAVREQGGELFEHARDMAAGARDTLMDQAQEQMQSKKAAGADYLEGLAGTLDRVAGEFDRGMPFAGQWMRQAATQVETVADAVREGDLNDLARQAQDFARRQPTVAFGVAMVAGFGLMRLLKTSAAGDAAGATGSSNRPGAKSGGAAGGGAQASTDGRRTMSGGGDR